GPNPPADSDGPAHPGNGAIRQRWRQWLDAVGLERIATYDELASALRQGT
ncbi:MAG: hypothetical protein JWQ03_2912, partial [Variovorax sp.]|nr:hypothetical protein [Variovorax sp.]